MNPCKERWNYLESIVSYPRFVRDLHVMEFERYINLLPSEILDMIDNFYSGDIYIIQNVLTKDEATSLRKRIFNWGKSIPPQSHKILDECPNHHIIVDSPIGPAGGYESIDHAYYFFRWNKDEVNIFPYVDEAWSQLKVISGFKPDEFKSNIPSDGTIDRIRAIHYPLFAGKISTHVDSPKNQKIIGGITLTDKHPKGNYENGGFYVLNSREEKVYLDEYAMGTCMIIFTTSMYHGVDIPTFLTTSQTSIETDMWNNINLGRFQIALFSPEPHSNLDREYALSIEQVKNQENIN